MLSVSVHWWHSGEWICLPRPSVTVPWQYSGGYSHLPRPPLIFAYISLRNISYTKALEEKKKLHFLTYN